MSEQNVGEPFITSAVVFRGNKKERRTTVPWPCTVGSKFENARQPSIQSKMRTPKAQLSQCHFS